MGNDRRIELQHLLEDILGSKNVYYQSPPNNEMKYPCIKYSKTKPRVKKANNRNYSVTNCYELIVIDRRPDNPVIEKIMDLPYCSYDRHYTSDDLNHDVLTLYY